MNSSVAGGPGAIKTGNLYAMSKGAYITQSYACAEQMLLWHTGKLWIVLL